VLEEWTRYVIKHRSVVFLVWILAIFLGVIGGSHLNSHLTTSLSIPNTPSARADSILAKEFSENVEGTFTVIYTFKNATTDEINDFEAKVARAAKVIPSSSIAAERALGGHLFVSVNSALSLTHAAQYTEPFRHALKAEGLRGAMVTGPPAIKSDVTPILASDLHRGELIGLCVALILLLISLGLSLQLFIPFLLALTSISATIGAIFLIAQKFLVVLYIPNIVELIGLGLSIDYSLLILFRYRREFAQNPETPTDAIVRTMGSAGRTIVLSAMTVTIALSTLILVPVPFVRSLGVAAALVPLLSLAVVFTLQPALLSLGAFNSTRVNADSRLFHRLAVSVSRRPVLVSISALVLLVGLALPTLALHITPSSLTAIPAQLESQRALSVVTSSIGSGVITPNELIIDLGSSSAAARPEIVRARQSLAAKLLKNSEVLAVANGAKPPYVDTSGRYIRLFVFARHSFGSAQAQELVKNLRGTSLDKYGFATRTPLYVGGAAAQGADLLRTLTRTLPWIVVLALLTIFLLLLRAFKSLILPIKAIALDLISLSVAYGIVDATFGNTTIARILGIYHLNQIEAWALLFLFVLLFGVSMDYEVFIISRIKEAKDRGLSDREAIIEGVSETGLVVTTAALIFVGAVSGLALGHFAGLQEIGIGLIFGVLIDATVVRSLLLPSAMFLLGRWNWWLPAPLARAIKN
jgi:RND superfamily putative drug exporter